MDVVALIGLYCSYETFSITSPLADVLAACLDLLIQGPSRLCAAKMQGVEML